MKFRNILLIIFVFILAFSFSSCNMYRIYKDIKKSDEREFVERFDPEVKGLSSVKEIYEQVYYETKKESDKLNEEIGSEPKDDDGMVKLNAEMNTRRAYPAIAYLENKYNKKFVYLTYWPKTLLDYQEFLIARPIDKKSSELAVTVEYNRNDKNDKIEFEDDYMCLLLDDMYKDYFRNSIRMLNKKARISIGAKVYRVIDDSMTTVPDNPKELDGKLIVDNYVMVAKKNVSYEDYKKLIEDFRQWLIEHKIAGSTEFFYVERCSPQFDLDLESMHLWRADDKHLANDEIYVDEDDFK